jgi:2-(1,2-epoxy-1,2-dihydrophenyl)acetyl-CoA isomerase
MAGAVLADRPRPGLLRLVMSQPGKKNAMDRAMREALLGALGAAAADEATHAVVLTGEGADYSAGGDLDGIAAIPPTEFRAYLAEGHRLVRAAYAFPKPLVAAVAGTGVGGGVALALCADRLVLARSARIGLPFLRIGFVPDWGTIHTLPRRVGPHAAGKLFARKGLIGAEEAAIVGLADELVEDASLEAAALDRAAALAALPPRGFAATKRMLREEAALDAALSAELDAQEAQFTGEFREGLAAFREKREPRFR